MSIFDETLQVISMIEVYTRCTGLQPKGNKAICPFHKDTRPSMVLYPKGFKCYVCDVHGSTINFYQMYRGIKKGITAVQMMNTEFGLGLDITPTKEKIATYRERRDKVDAFNQWEKTAFQEMNTAHKLAKGLLAKINFDDEDEGLSEYYCGLVNFIGHLDMWTDTLIYGTLEEKVQLKQTLLKQGMSYGLRTGCK